MTSPTPPPQQKRVIPLSIGQQNRIYGKQTAKVWKVSLTGSHLTITAPDCAKGIAGNTSICLLRAKSTTIEAEVQ